MSTGAAQRSASMRYDATTSTVAPTSTTRERLLSLDVFRGITVAGMLLVNDPGTWSAIFPPLEHAEWNGWTPTDLIFPFFLFIVGITTHLSLSARRARGDDDSATQDLFYECGVIVAARAACREREVGGDADDEKKEREDKILSLIHKYEPTRQ
jgi:uncharacterized membrane protein